MSFSKYTKRRGQFEVLEAKQLFAADLMGGAAADLPDTPVVAGFEPGDLVAEIDPGDLVSVEMNPGDGLMVTLPYVGLRQQADTALVSEIQSDRDGGPSCLGGQEGEPVMDPDDCPNLMLNGIARGTQEESGGAWLASSSDLQEEASQIENVSASPKAPDNLVPDTDCEFRIIGIAKGTQEE